jgi:hypothetical protein
MILWFRQDRIPAKSTKPALSYTRSAAGLCLWGGTTKSPHSVWVKANRTTCRMPAVPNPWFQYGGNSLMSPIRQRTPAGLCHRPVRGALRRPGKSLLNRQLQQRDLRRTPCRIYRRSGSFPNRQGAVDRIGIAAHPGHPQRPVVISRCRFRGLFPDSPHPYLQERMDVSSPRALSSLHGTCHRRRCSCTQGQQVVQCYNPWLRSIWSTAIFTPRIPGIQMPGQWPFAVAASVP